MPESRALETIKEFLSLPPGALPGAEYTEGGVPGLVPAWDALRAVAAGDPDDIGDMMAGEIRLTAARSGWPRVVRI